MFNTAIIVYDEYFNESDGAGWVVKSGGSQIIRFETLREAKQWCIQNVIAYFPPEIE